MRFGLCGSPDTAAIAKAAGFDYLEVNTQSVLRGLDDDATWASAAPGVDRLVLPLETANCLVPGSLKLVGPERDLGLIRTYMRRVCDRAPKLGITRLVFGSGDARQRPDGVDDAVALDHLAEFLTLSADLAGEAGVVIVIEHLNRGECNMLNSLRACDALARRVDHSAIRMLVDSYHLGVEKEPLSDVTALGDRLQHAHVAEPVGRVQPGAHGDSANAFNFTGFFRTLRDIGYDQRVSFEGKFTASLETDGAACVETLRRAYEESAAETKPTGVSR